MEENKAETQFNEYAKSWSKALDRQMDAAGASRECPICKNTKWTLIGGVDENGDVVGLGVPFFAGQDVKGYFPAATLSCDACGFVKQHIISDKKGI